MSVDRRLTADRSDCCHHSRDQPRCRSHLVAVTEML